MRPRRMMFVSRCLCGAGSSSSGRYGGHRRKVGIKGSWSRCKASTTVLQHHHHTHYLSLLSTLWWLWPASSPPALPPTAAGWSAKLCTLEPAGGLSSLVFRRLLAFCVWNRVSELVVVRLSHLAHLTHPMSAHKVSLSPPFPFPRLSVDVGRWPPLLLLDPLWSLLRLGIILTLVPSCLYVCWCLESCINTSLCWHAAAAMTG